MELGAFSVSLAVKDLIASQAFYEQLGFRVFHGDPGQHWLIMRNGNCVLGLFQGMFEKNMLTFNPGWDQAAQPTEPLVPPVLALSKVERPCEWTRIGCGVRYWRFP